MSTQAAAGTPDPVRQVAVPPEARDLSTLSRVDYADAFVVEMSSVQDRTAEQWIRAMMEAAPARMQRRLRRAWSALGFRLGPTGSDRFVLGWEVRRNTPDYVLLGASSRIGMPAELLLMRRQDTLLFDTFVQIGNPFARAVWAVTEPGHQPVVRYVLEQAARGHMRSTELSMATGRLTLS